MASPRSLMSRIGYLLNRPALQIRRMAEAALKPLGLVPPHMAVISTLASEGPQTQRALGAWLKVDPATMVWLIDHLEKKGLVRRKTSGRSPGASGGTLVRRSCGVPSRGAAAGPFGKRL